VRQQEAVAPVERNEPVRSSRRAMPAVTTRRRSAEAARFLFESLSLVPGDA